MEKKTQLNVWYLLFAMLAVLALQRWWQTSQTVQVADYSEFQRAVADGKIARVVVTEKHLIGRFKEPEQGKLEIIAERVDPAIADQLRAAGIEVAGATESTWLRDLLSWIVPVLLMVAIWMFVYRRMADRIGGGGGLVSLGRSKAKVYVESDTKVTFADVAGLHEAKEELQEIIDFLRERERYGALGARIPKGVLLVGPPGTGKTLLARAVAGEASVPFFSISGSEFVELFVGLGAARVRDLFEQARKSAPAIIFVDELDALGRARSPYAGFGGQDEREQTLNQLLSELDGFDPRVGVVLLAATNQPEVLDPALLRSGRFDRQVLVDRPDRPDRVEILQVHVRKVKIEPGVELEQIAALTPGFTGADLANLVNEAALLATRRRAEAVAMRDFNEAIERIVAGLEKKSRLLVPKERRLVAVHEMGHALVGLAIPGADIVHKVSIIPRGVGALGYTIQRPTDDRHVMLASELEDKIAVLLGGRAAEALLLGATSTGAADDLARATDIARAMVMRYGMDEQLGPVSFDREHVGAAVPFVGATYFERRYSEGTAQRIDQAVQRHVEAGLARATAILTLNRELLERGTARLLEVETLSAEQLRELAAPLQLPAPA